jgi:hypothetical protein
MVEMRNKGNIFVGRPEGKRPLRWTILLVRMDVKEIG